MNEIKGSADRRRGGDGRQKSAPSSRKPPTNRSGRYPRGRCRDTSHEPDRVALREVFPVIRKKVSGEIDIVAQQMPICL